MKKLEIELTYGQYEMLKEAVESAYFSDDDDIERFVIRALRNAVREAIETKHLIAARLNAARDWDAP